MRVFLTFLLLLASAATGLTQKNDDKPSASHDDSAALTIYNQSFAVVRQTLPLDLKSGTNQLEITDITAHLEPDSVILRDLKSGRDLRILEQNYRSDVASQGRLLALYEGKTIEFLVPDKDGNRRLVPGKIIRSGYTPHYQTYSAYDQQYYQAQQAYVAAGNGEPIIEIDGKLQFGLPGLPVFPALSNDTILKPTLSWLLQSDHPGNTNAEFSYVTGGMSWHADYNVVAPVSGNLLDIVGWVTLDNQTGKTFQNAHIKLMAGDVNKLVGAGPGMGAADSITVYAKLEAAQRSPSAALTNTISIRWSVPPLFTIAKPSRLNSSAPRVCRRSGSMFTMASNWTRTTEAIRWSRSATWRISASSPIPRSGRWSNLKTASKTILACRCPRVGCASTGAILTASLNSPART
jgi:hypothetical protein